MNFIKYFKKRILQKKIKTNNKRDKAFHYIEDSEKIAFIINSDNNSLIKLYEYFIKDLKKQKKIISELFISKIKTKKEQNLPENTVSIADNNWIKSDIVQKFISGKYDILFVVFEKMVLEVQYLSSTIKADLKISPNYTNFNTADITFHVEEDNFNEYFKAINQYIRKNKK
ncbi:MAG: hypothetical protein U9Q83_04020 [Bacteroidota bacterium]|nr:hypothetical protein [Bacteroidota bacterium]